jgi:hypothetical protein
MPISTINTNSIADDAVTVPKVTDQVLTHRNLIINGAMQVAQRGTSSSNSGIQAVDRIGVSGAWNEWTFTQEQSSDAPAGFSNSFKLSTTAAEVSLDAGDLVYINQGIEAQNLQHLKYGTSGAETCTLSFWVKSSIAGVFGISLYQDDGSYILTPTYTINAANTWEYKTISVSGNTLGAPANDNGNGIRVSFIVAAGSTYNDGTSRTSWESYSTNKFGSGHVQNGVMTTLNATFQITGVQLEVGDTATPFEHRTYGDEFARCQRYYEYGRIVQLDTTVITGSFVVLKRAAPTMTRLGNTWTASEGGTFGPFDNSAYYVQSGGTSYVGGQWSADAEL